MSYNIILYHIIYYILHHIIYHKQYLFIILKILITRYWQLSKWIFNYDQDQDQEKMFIETTPDT